MGLQTASVSAESGRTLSFDVVEGLDGPASFFLSVRKSGSTMLTQAATALALAGGRNVVNAPDRFFDAGWTYKEWNRASALEPLLAKGNVYVGFRDAPSAIFGHPVFEDAAKILLVRDPRDVLVSEYFSNAYSHPLPITSPEESIVAQERAKAQAVSIDEYVLTRSRDLNHTLEFFRPLLERKDIRVFRYEDIIFEKRSWLSEVAGICNLDVSANDLDAIFAQIDLRPETEDPLRFVRKVTPGDHREKLLPGTIEELAGKLSDIWGQFGYDLKS